MRPSFTVSLLLLSLLLSEKARGIRLEKGSKLVGHESIHEEEMALNTNTNNGEPLTEEEEAVMCRDGECSGNNRKLNSVTPSSTTTTTTTTTCKNEKNGKSTTKYRSQQFVGHEEKANNSLVINSSTINSGQNSEETEIEGYPDGGDLAEMDYFPASRKTPIHN